MRKIIRIVGTVLALAANAWSSQLLNADELLSAGRSGNKKLASRIKRELRISATREAWLALAKLEDIDGQRHVLCQSPETLNSLDFWLNEDLQYIQGGFSIAIYRSVLERPEKDYESIQSDVLLSNGGPHEWAIAGLAKLIPDGPGMPLDWQKKSQFRERWLEYLNKNRRKVASLSPRLVLRSLSRSQCRLKQSPR
jgi:hypothetical protein